MFPIDLGQIGTTPHGHHGTTALAAINDAIHFRRPNPQGHVFNIEQFLGGLHPVLELVAVIHPGGLAAAPHFDPQQGGGEIKAAPEELAAPEGVGAGHEHPQAKGEEAPGAIPVRQPGGKEGHPQGTQKGQQGGVKTQGGEPAEGIGFQAISKAGIEMVALGEGLGFFQQFGSKRPLGANHWGLAHVASVGNLLLPLGL